MSVDVWSQVGIVAAVWWVAGQFELAVGGGSLVGGWVTDEGYVRKQMNGVDNTSVG